MSKDVRNSDVDIDEEVRRRSGDFYTPKIWVDEAHKSLDAELGPNWRDEYVVWDCASGTANLTRDYSFKELYLSTLYDEDANTIRDIYCNTGAEIFQFDFLNDILQGDGIHGDIEASSPNVPEGLLAALRSGKKFVFLINPPFGTAKTNAKDTGEDKTGVADTAVNLVMGLGGAKKQLYAQFMYRITEIVKRFGLEDSVFALYSKSLFFSGPSFGKFREYFYQNWEFKEGFLFRADEFDGASNQWGCSFTLWRRGTEARSTFNLTTKVRNEVGIITDQGVKAFYTPLTSANTWVKSPRNMWHGKGVDVPQLSSAIRVQQTGYGTLAPGALGYFFCIGGNIYNAGSGTNITSSTFSNGKGVHIFPCNYLRTVALFTARKSVSSNWINDNDEFCAPDTTLPGYDQWNADCIVFSLFQASSQQSSMRDVEYKGKLWDIQNEFFWMSNEEIKSLADEHGFKSLSKDCSIFNQDRHVYKVLQEVKLSPDAQEILDMASKLVRKSIPLREVCHSENPKFHLQAWDAGWYQIRKGILEVYFPDEYKEFTQKFLTFRDRMREGVYEFGFLRR